MLVVGVWLGVAAGCKPESHGPPAGPTTSNDLEGRLKAALAISDTNKRDTALHAVANAAGAAGDPRVVKSAVSSISSTNVKDAAAESSALALAKAGLRTEAAEVARLISDTNKRDAALSRLAKE